MSRPEDTRPDSPQVQVELQTPHSKHTQTLDIQSNRVSPVEKFIWHWLNWLYPPADPADFALDAGSYVLAGRLLCSLLLRFASLLNSTIALVMLWLVLAVAASLCWFVCTEIKRGWMLLVYRVVLLATGAYLGGLNHGN